MTTLNLTRTNIIPEEQAAIIEEIIGCKITGVVTYNKNIPEGQIVIGPYTKLYPGHYEFRNLAYVVRDVNFNNVTGQLVIKCRNRWQRSFINKIYQLQIIGYKLPTTNVHEGYIWGNAQLIN